MALVDIGVRVPPAAEADNVADIVVSFRFTGRRCRQGGANLEAEMPLTWVRCLPQKSQLRPQRDPLGVLSVDGTDDDNNETGINIEGLDRADDSGGDRM